MKLILIHHKNKNIFIPLLLLIYVIYIYNVQNIKNILEYHQIMMFKILY